MNTYRAIRAKKIDQVTTLLGDNASWICSIRWHKFCYCSLKTESFHPWPITRVDSHEFLNFRIFDESISYLYLLQNSACLYPTFNSVIFTVGHFNVNSFNNIYYANKFFLSVKWKYRGLGLEHIEMYKSCTFTFHFYYFGFSFVFGMQ